MAKHTLAEAAKLTGKSRSTIHRKMEKGQLSYSTNEDGNRVVDTSELVRVYGELKQDVKPDTVAVTQNETQNDTGETLTLRLENKYLKEKLNVSQQREDQLIHELTETRQQHQIREEKLLGIVEKQTLMLEKPREEPKTQEPQRNWLTIGLVALNIVLLIALALKEFAF